MRLGHVKLGAQTRMDAMEADDLGLTRSALEILALHLDDPDYGSMARSEAGYCLWMLAKASLAKGDYPAARHHVERMGRDIPYPDRLGEFNQRLLESILAVLAGEGSKRELASLNELLRELKAGYPGLVPESVLEDFSDLYLLQRALKVTDATPYSRSDLRSGAALLHALRTAGGSGARRSQLLKLAREAAAEDVYRRQLFELAMDGASPDEAVRRALGE